MVLVLSSVTTGLDITWCLISGSLSFLIGGNGIMFVKLHQTMKFPKYH